MTRLAERIRQERGGPLLGVAIYRYDPVFVEIVGYSGFHILWICMEHAPTSFREAGDLCRIATGVGMLSMIRVPDATRENVLRAAECGPDILDLPMTESAEGLRQFVRHARYPPVGNRGFFGSSRAVRYCLSAGVSEEQTRVNRELALMAQIETSSAAQRAEEICNVDGVDAIFVGPGDLSASLGVPGQVSHPAVVKAVKQTIAVAKANGKHVAVAVDACDAAKWARRGADILFCGSDIACLKMGVQGLLESARRKQPPPKRRKTRRMS